MITTESILKSADNSGAKILKCIKILGNFKKRTASTGEVILVCVKKLDRKKKIKKKNVYLALLISTKRKIRRLDGTFFSSKNNRVLLLSETYKFLGTRVYGFISKEIRSKTRDIERYKKIISYAKATL
jgi:large subunit ribosomal protein L14